MSFERLLRPATWHVYRYLHIFTLGRQSDVFRRFISLLSACGRFGMICGHYFSLRPFRSWAIWFMAVWMRTALDTVDWSKKFVCFRHVLDKLLILVNS